MKAFLFALLAIFGACQADLVNHYKSVSEKQDNHSIPNIDFIYMINLDQRPEKYQKCLKKLLPYGINPYRFSAVNGWRLTLDVLNDVGVKLQPGVTSNLLCSVYLSENKQVGPKNAVARNSEQTFFSHGMSRGAIGIVLSHLSVLYDAYQSGYETIWVMEDDIEVLRNPNLISKYIEKLDKLTGAAGWDILFTDKNTKGPDGKYVHCSTYAKRPNFQPVNPAAFSIRKPAGRDFFKIGARYGAYSMVVRRSGMKKILDFFESYKIFLPYDMDFFLPEGIRLFTLTNDVVSTVPGALSDNLTCGYLKKK